MKNGFRFVKGGLRKRKPLSFIYGLFVSYHTDFPLPYSIEERFVGIPCGNMLRPFVLFIADRIWVYSDFIGCHYVSFERPSGQERVHEDELHSLMRSILDWAVEEGLLSSNI